MITLDFNPAEIVAKAIANGWVRPGAVVAARKVEMKSNVASRVWHAKKRAANRLVGLNWMGQPYSKRCPKIKGLSHDHAKYMRVWREQRRQAALQSMARGGLTT